MTTETFTYSNYFVREKVRSEIDPDWVHNVEIGFTCPRCKTLIKPMMKHAEVRSCPSCNLRMQLHGNALICSTEPFAYENVWRGTHD